MANVDVSIVIPVFNSEGSLNKLADEIDRVFKSRSQTYELILVNDGSKDGSWKVMQEIVKRNGSVRGIQLKRNYGQHNAIMCGFNFCEGKVVITMDDDLQHPPSEITKLLDRYQETQAELIYGVYDQEKKHGFARNVGSKVIKTSSKHLENAGGQGSSFRLIELELVRKVLDRSSAFVFIDEILNWFAKDIELVKVEHHKREIGRSGYTLWKLFQMTFHVTINYTAFPLRIMTYGGVLLSFVSFLIGIYYIIKKLFFNVEVPGFTATIVAILFGFSLMLICFGIIGQYLFKLYHMNIGKPTYKIDKVIINDN